MAHNGGKWQLNLMFPWCPAEFPFANVLKASGNLADWDYSEVSPDHVSAQGYALPGQSIRFVDVPIPSQSELPGNYRFRWKGTATIGVVGATLVSGSLSGTDGEAWLHFPNPGTTGVNYGGDATDPAYDMSLVHEDYCASYDGGNLWNPRLIERLLECRPGTIRFLDWVNPNSPYAHWEHRKPLDYSVWSGNEYRGSAYVTTTNVGNNFTTSGSGGVLKHGELAIVNFSATWEVPYSTARLNWKGTGFKPILETTGYPLPGYQGEAPAADTYHTCVYDSVLDAWLMDGGYSWQSYPLKNGVPPEACIDLCNRVCAHCWIPIPYLATDPLTDYAPSLAKLARDTLKPGLKLINEAGNEVWNTYYSYPNTHWAFHREVLAWGPAQHGEHSGYRFYNQMTANIGRAVSDVFGGDRSRFAIVSAMQGVAYYKHSVEQSYAENLWRYNTRCKGENYYADTGHYASEYITDVSCTNYWGAAEQDTANQGTLNTEYLTATPTRKAEILNEYSLGPLDMPENLHRQYSGRAPLDTTLGYNLPWCALKYHAEHCYATWGQIAKDNGHGFVAYEGGFWTQTEVGLDARQLGTAARDLVRFDFQNWLDAGGTFPSQYWLASPRWNISLLSPSIYAPDSPQYLGVLDFNKVDEPPPPQEHVFIVKADAIVKVSVVEGKMKGAIQMNATFVEGDDS